MCIEQLQNVHIKVKGSKKALKQTDFHATDKNIINATFKSNDFVVSTVELSGIKKNCSATLSYVTLDGLYALVTNVNSYNGKIEFELESRPQLKNFHIIVHGTEAFRVYVTLAAEQQDGSY
ncbi:hypothetical protein SlGVgp122 [Spodoptera litura granulovirus]|uniref:Uncharacterized protein n=1 Tax=Spodoptera litura granulovirus TaxID=359919 RepID=A5IZX4_9BBAC|nr:hypothetical protein SlGVgp122 [Spodoptera litura granulovirus]ABQ52065.1 hypothetical protein SlGVgp122 [Spodoptera litura granulovirus]